MKLKTTLCAAAATMALAPAAHAYEGLYGAIGAGMSYLGQDLDFDQSAGLITPFAGDIDYDKGIGVYTSLGYDYGNNWRTELEFSYRSNDVRHIVNDGTPPTPGFGGWPDATLNGDLTTYSLMANAIYDFNFGNKWVTPYVGVGAGVVFSDLDLSGNAPLPSGTLQVNGRDTRVGVQGLAGLAFKLADNLNLDLGYRYQISQDHKLNAVQRGAAGNIDHGFRGHSLFAGLRWNFGAAAPAPAMKDCWDGSQVAATAECPPQPQQQSATKPDPMNVIVYFDYDKSNLTPEAADLIKEAAARALANNIDRVKVEGNADRSGGSAYNAALSQRRANVVRDALIANGVPADKIDTSSFGEDNPAKPTADGVREPLNRRTEVKITFM
jgi:outer membrane protein OmpA-like peptidoglycan-associated protein